MQASLFDILPVHRQVESWNKVTKNTTDRQLLAVKNALLANPDGLTSREPSKVTGIERTSITRTLSNNSNEFDTTGEKLDELTNRTVTLYRVKL